MQILKGTTLLDRSFQTSITLKGIDGLLEIIGGILVLVANQTRINSFVDVITRHSLARNPNAFIATHLLHASQGIVGHAHYFIFFYLVSHGLAKVILVVALWLNRMWAYPAMILLLISLYSLSALPYDVRAIVVSGAADVVRCRSYLADVGGVRKAAGAEDAKGGRAKRPLRSASPPTLIRFRKAYQIRHT